MSNKQAQARRRSQEQASHDAANVEGTHDIERSHQTPHQAGMEAQEVPREDDSAMRWTRPSSFTAPPTRPGYVQRWKRYMLGNEYDARNWQRAIQEGWKPRPADTVSESFAYLRNEEGNIGEVISAQGLILCEMPEQMARQRQAHYANAAARQIDGVDRDLHRVQTPGMPIQNDRQSTSETGRRPRVAD